MQPTSLQLARIQFHVGGSISFFSFLVAKVWKVRGQRGKEGSKVSCSADSRLLEGSAPEAAGKPRNTSAFLRFQGTESHSSFTYLSFPFWRKSKNG